MTKQKHEIKKLRAGLNSGTANTVIRSIFKHSRFGLSAVLAVLSLSTFRFLNVLQMGCYCTVITAIRKLGMPKTILVATAITVNRFSISSNGSSLCRHSQKDKVFKHKSFNRVSTYE